MTAPRDVDQKAASNYAVDGPSVATRMIVNVVLLLALTPAVVFLGWGFILGILAGVFIGMSVRWVNRAPDAYMRRGSHV